MPRYPKLFQTVLDTKDARELAEFYRQLLGLAYRLGDEPDATEGDRDWLVLLDSSDTTCPRVPAGGVAATDDLAGLRRADAAAPRHDRARRRGAPRTATTR